MKILQLIDTLKAGGAERMSVNISNALKDAGHDVVLCASREKGPLEKFVDKGIMVVTLQKKNTFDIIAFIRLLLFVKRNKIELIHAHSSSVIWAVAIKLFRPKIKVLWHDHQGTRLDDDNMNKYYRLISHFLDGIITVNEVLHDWAIRNMNVPSGKIVFLNNFPLLPERPKQTTPGFTTIVCLANIRPQKDHYTLVRAIHILKKEDPNLKINVIFAGSYSPDTYYYCLVDLIEELELKETIHIEGSIEDTAMLLASADIGVLSSISEGLPVSLLEYGLAGLPVVVTNVGQCSDVLGGGEYGKLVHVGQSVEFAESIKEVVRNYKQSLIIGGNFKKHVLKNYSSVNFINQYNYLITNI
jgi:glycosyltransferase involved in cell wall biosynthesis